MAIGENQVCVLEPLLNLFLITHFAKPFPKSTGREEFNFGFWLDAVGTIGSAIPQFGLFTCSMRWRYGAYFKNPSSDAIVSVTQGKASCLSVAVGVKMLYLMSRLRDNEILDDTNHRTRCQGSEAAPVAGPADDGPEWLRKEQWNGKVKSIVLKIIINSFSYKMCQNGSPCYSPGRIPSGPFRFRGNVVASLVLYLWLPLTPLGRPSAGHNNLVCPSYNKILFKFQMHD